MQKTNGFRVSRHGKNGRADHRSHGNGSTVSLAKRAAPESSKRLAHLFVSVARDLFGKDDQVAELPLRQLRVCAILHDGPKSMSQLGRELDVSLSAMTQIADRLERSHLVKRSFEGTDRRVRCLQLTARGQRIMRLREQARSQRLSQVLRKLSAGEQASLINALETLLQACEQSRE